MPPALKTIVNMRLSLNSGTSIGPALQVLMVSFLREYAESTNSGVFLENFGFRCYSVDFTIEGGGH